MKKVLGGVSALSGKGNASFVRLERHAGELCAVIESQGRIKAKLKSEPGEDHFLEAVVKGVEYRSLRLGHTIKSTIEGTARLVITKKQKDAEVTIEMKGALFGEEITELKE